MQRPDMNKAVDLDVKHKFKQIKWAQRPDMTIPVEWDAKAQLKLTRHRTRKKTGGRVG